MIVDYIEAALKLAHYEIIGDEEPFYGEVVQLKGLWATGKTLEQCRANLASTIEGWVLVRISRGMQIPPLGEVRVALPQELEIA